MDELGLTVIHDEQWEKAHNLFDQIRRKRLVAERDHNQTLVVQYSFEEICAKTLYNLSHSPAPFDPDSPYWIVPSAFALARTLRIEDSRVLEIVAA